jgi:hypothetical protein
MQPGNLARAGLRSAHLILAIGLTAFCADAQVSSIAYTGTLFSTKTVVPITFALTAADTIIFQTWGFGGGVNAAGTTISPGGFEPLLTLYSGTVTATSIETDAGGIPLADAGILRNPPWSFAGNCAAAGKVQIGSNDDCGDVKMQAALTTGTYTLLLSYSGYLPGAIFDGGSISAPYVDLASVQFQSCDPGANACIDRNGNYAVDIVGTKSSLLAISKCDINQDKSTNVTDVQLMANQAFGSSTPDNDLNIDGVIDVVDVQYVIEAVLGHGCKAK